VAEPRGAILSRPEPGCRAAGSFGSVQELTDAIFSYLGERNLAPKRYGLESNGRGNLGEDQTSARVLERNN